MLTSLHNVLAQAHSGAWALGAFNTYNLEISAAIVAGAEQARAPVIVQTGVGALRGAASTALPALILALGRAATVPVALHLDHCGDLALIERCLDLGYTSIMVDGSALSFVDNIQLTRQAVTRGHAAGVIVEAELTGIAGDEDHAEQGRRPRAFTDPAQAARFVAETGVDLLAVSIGNVHGRYHGEPRLDFALLDELASRVPVPLVLHGASGLSDESLRQAVARGIAKINFNTELRTAYCDALASALPAAARDADIVALMTAAGSAVQAVVEAKLRIVGAAGRAG
ncbi:MAG TPA: class II fructose-bisphosphate aldolase [Chloroflexota bacterium]|nr:class II fructose-bisphosphate aldolase [Chloroflexota bacterium]